MNFTHTLAIVTVKTSYPYSASNSHWSLPIFS